MLNRNGRLIGGVAGPDGAPAICELAYASGGTWESRISPYTLRVTIPAATAGAWLELHLSRGRWHLMLTRHGWSGHVPVRDAARYAIHDLHAAPDDSGILEIPVESVGEAQPVRIEATGSRVTEGVHGQFMALRTDTGVADYLATSGIWEADSVRIFGRYVPGSRLALDVGANIGHHTVVLSQLLRDSGRVLAFEPQMQMYHLLIANLALNGCSNVAPYRMALGAQVAALPMYPINHRSFTNFGALGIQPGNEAQERKAVEPLDQFLGRQGIAHAEVGFLKLDVQSYEYFVLHGARQVLHEARPVVYCEVAPRSMRRAGYDYGDIYRLPEGLGYGFLDDAEAPHAQPDWDGESAAEWNILARPDRQRHPLVVTTHAAPASMLAEAGVPVPA